MRFHTHKRHCLPQMRAPKSFTQPPCTRNAVRQKLPPVHAYSCLSNWRELYLQWHAHTQSIPTLLGRMPPRASHCSGMSSGLSVGSSCGMVPIGMRSPPRKNLPPICSVSPTKVSSQVVNKARTYAQRSVELSRSPHDPGKTKLLRRIGHEEISGRCCRRSAPKVGKEDRERCLVYIES